jgi:hypothetical protein
MIGTPKTLPENLARQLRDSVDRLQQQAEKVEFWASAISTLSEPVPEYDPETTRVERYVKPARPARKRRRRRASSAPADGGGGSSAT